MKLVIFDLDGTLMDAYPAVYESVNAAFERFGLQKVSHHTVKRAVGWGDRHLLQTLSGQKDVDRMLMFYRRHHADALRKDTRLLPGALEVLRWLKDRGLKLAVASNRPTKFSRIALEHLKVLAMFDCVLCADKVRRGKPSPDLLKAVLRRLGLRPGQALYVGDMTIDVLTGRRARVKTVAVATGSNTQDELARLAPEAVIRRIRELKKYVLLFEGS